MVAIYIPALQAAAPVYNHIAKPHNLDYKTAFFLRALHACNGTKENRITCLGKAVTCNRRCRNPLHNWTIVLAEMIEAAEDGSLYFEDLKSYAVKWAVGLSCYLHGTQKGVVMAAMGAVAVYRQTFPANVVVAPRRVQRSLPVHVAVSKAVDRGAQNSLSREASQKVLKCIVEECDKACAMLEEFLLPGTASQFQNLQRLDVALLSVEKSVLLLCESAVCWLERREMLSQA